MVLSDTAVNLVRLSLAWDWDCRAAAAAASACRVRGLGLEGRPTGAGAMDGCDDVRQGCGSRHVGGSSCHGGTGSHCPLGATLAGRTSGASCSCCIIPLGCRGSGIIGGDGGRSREAGRVM